MNCAIPKEQIQRVSALLLKDIQKMITADQKNFSVVPFAQKIYSLVRKNNDENTALAYAMMVPELISGLSYFVPEVRNYLARINYSDKLSTSIETFKNIEEVKKLIATRTNSLQTILEIIDLQRIVLGQYEAIEDKKRKIELNTSEPLFTYSSSPNTDTREQASQIQQEKVTVPIQTLRDEEDPVKNRIYKFKEKVYKQQKNNEEPVPGQPLMYNGKPLYYTMMAHQNLDIELDQEYLGSGDFESLLFIDEEQLEEMNRFQRSNLYNRRENLTILIVTDAKGVPYLFDNEGNITEDGTGGVIYNFTRDKDKIATLKSPEQIAAQLELIRRLEETKKYVTENNTQVTMPITSIGSSNYDKTPGLLRDIRIDASDEQIDSEDWIRRNGVFDKFLKITNLVRNLSDEPVEAVKPYFKDVSGLTEAIIMLLSEQNIPVENINISSDTRYKYLETFFVKIGNNLLTTVKAKDRPLVTYNKSAETVTIKDTNGENTHYEIGNENLKSALEEVFKQNILVNINRTNLTNGIYTDIKVENGELKVKDNSNYYSWLYNNIKVRASRPNAEGQIVALNPLFRYTLPDLDTLQKTPDVEQETAPAKEKTVEEQDNDNLNPGNPDLFNLSFDDLFRATNLENAVTEEQIRDAEKWWANSPLSKVIPLNRLLSVVNSNAWATFSRSGITLYKGSSSVDIYHEAWHGFTQLYLTTEEKVKLYKEVRKKPGVFTTVTGEVVSFSDASFFQIEEYLAEQFRDYARFQNPEKGSPVKNTIFRKIWNFLKALFGGTNRNAVYVDAMSVPAVAEAFEKLYFGKLLNLQPNINNSMFDVLNSAKSVKDDETPLNIEDEFDLIRQSIDGLVAKALIDIQLDGTRSNNLAFLYSSKGRTTIFERILNTFKNKLADINEELESLEEKPNNLLDQKRLLEIVIENFGDIESFANNKKTNGILAAYAQTSSAAISNLVVAEEDIDIDFDLDTSNSSELLQQGGDKRPNSRPMKDFLPKELTTILRLIPSFKKATQKEINNESYDFSIGEEKFVYIKNKLGFPINQEFGSTLNALQKTVVGLKTYTEMLDAIKNAQNAFPVLKVIYELLPKEHTLDRALAQNINIVKILLEGVFNFHSAFDKASVEALINTKSNVLVDENGTDTKQIFTSGKATNSVGNVYRRWQNIFVNVAPRINNEAVLNTNNLPNTVNTFEEAFEFFERLGVQLTKTTKEVIQAGKSGITLNDLLSAANAMLSDIRNNPNNKKLKSNPLQAFIERSTDSNINNQRTILRKIAQIEIKYNPLFNDSIILNANGDLVSSISLHNSMTRKVMYLNESINLLDAADFNVEFSEELNPFFKYSIIREKLFYENGSRNNLNKLELMFHVGYQQRDEYDNIENASSATDLTINEKFITDFYSFILHGYMPTLVHESKSSVYVPMITNKNGSAELYLEPKLFENTLLPDDAIRLLQRYIKAEYERIVLFKTNETYKQNQALNKDGAGEKFTAFDDILSPNTKDALYADIDAGLTSDESVSKNIDAIKEDLEYYFVQVNKQNQNRYNQSAPLVPVDETQLRKFNLNVKDDKLKNTLVRAYTVNYFIHRFEMNNFFYGDMAQYDHKKEAGTKYDAGAGSGGPGFISDQWVLQAINKAYPKVYSEKVMSKLRPGGVVKETTSILNTAIIQEDTGLRSVSLNEMIEAVVKLKAAREKRSQKAVRPEVVQSFEKAYGKEMKIGDGHGYMPIDTYRHLKLAQNNWLPEQEALYQKIVNGEKLEANDAKVFFPTYKLQMYGNLQTNAPVTALHKFSISPLIPNVHEDSLLNDIHNIMIINNIDYITYPSGSKISNLGNPTNLYENGDRNKINMSADFTVNPVNLAYLKEVTSNTNVWKAGQTFATQMRKLIVENLYLDGVVLPDKVELVKDYLRLVDEVTKNLEKDFLDEIGWVKEGNTYSGPVERLAAFLQTQLRKKNLPEHIVKQIFVDANGNLTNDLSALPNAQTIEAIMFSTISRRLIKQKSYGEGLVQVPGSFWRKANESERKKWLGTNEFLPFYKYNPKKIQAAKVAITLHGDFINLFQRKDLNGNIIAVYDIVEEKDGTKKRVLDIEASRVKLNQLIKNDKWLDQDDNRQAISILGVRIPVQGQGSIDALEVYEFLPIGAGNIIVLPSEIVGKSGGDFDFDKLPSLFPRINKNGKIISVKKYKTRQALLDELARLEKENDLDKKDVIERVKDVIKDLKADKKVNKETISNIIRNLEYAKVRKKLIVDEINKIINNNRENGQLQFLPSPLQKVLSKPDYTDGDIIKALRISSKILTKDKSRSILEKFSKRLFDQITEFDKFKDESDNLREELKSALEDKGQFDKEIEESIEDLKEIIYVIDVENNYVGALQTDLLETSLEIILSPQNYESLVTPNSTDIFDDLAKELKRLTQTYNPLLNFSEEFTGVISPTRLFESDYNLSKYEAYMTAMDALGIGAIMNTYNILLNSLKGVSPKEYVLDKKDDLTVPIRMLLPKNVTKDGNISLHNTYSYRTDKKAPLVRISDIFSQMINGWVDVGKDPWIFYIQGNREITPVLMYMLMAGVPVEHAVYFVSQPLVRKFIALKKEKGANEAYKSLLKNKNKNDIILESLNNEEEFQLNDLKKQLIPENVDPEYQEKVLRHFIEISNVSEAFTKFSRATNVDTTRENSYLSTREREASLNELLYDGRIDRSLVEAIQNSEKSIIGSFFIGDFAIALTKSVLPFRFDARIDNFINKLSGKIETDNPEFNSLQESYTRLSKSQTSNKATGTELLDAAFRDELVLALYQNAVRGFRLGVSDSYKGFGVSETVPVQYVDYLKKGVYLTKDKIYISASEIQRKYESLSNDFRNKEFPTIHEYTRFLIERAIVELTQPNSTDSQKENRAYINSFNFYKLFQDPALSFANVFYRNILKKDFSEELLEQFPVLSYFLTNSKTYPGYVILDFIGKSIDDITATSYYSQLKQLKDFTAVKNRMPNLSDSNIKLINYVFTMLPQIAFLQNGFSKNVSNLVNLVDLSEVNATIQDAISDFDFSEQSLLNFAEGFISGQTRKTKVPVRQYSLAPVKISRSELVPGAFSYRLPGGETVKSNYVPSKNFRNLLFTNEQYVKLGYPKPYDYYDLVIKQDQTGGVYVVYPTTLDATEAARSPYLRNTTTRAKYLPISIGFKEVGDGFIEGGRPTTPTTQATQAPVSKGFQGYKGGFENTGKGTPEGDGKDKAMRKIATGSIVEFKTDKVKSSSLTTFETVGKDNAYSYAKDRYVGQSYNGVKNGKNNYGAVVMLARNGKLSGTKLSEDTKAEIKIAYNQGSEFVVGDMPNVDSQFIDYLQEIGAKFTIYHTGSTPRIEIKQTTQPSTQAPETAEQIYSQLGDRTFSGNVTKEKWSVLEKETKAINPNYIVSTRIKNTENHFGNFYSSIDSSAVNTEISKMKEKGTYDNELKRVGGKERDLRIKILQSRKLIPTETTQESVEKYINWILTGETGIVIYDNTTPDSTDLDFRREWILEQLELGSLKGKPIKYFTEIGEPSHATALDYLINKHDWSKLTQTEPSPVVQGNTPSIEEAKKRINEQLSQIEEILSNPRNAVVMDMSLLINDILKQNTPQIAGSKVIAEYLYGELYKRFNLPVPGSSKFGVMDLIIENQEGIAGETLVSEDLIGLDLDGTCFRA